MDSDEPFDNNYDNDECVANMALLPSPICQAYSDIRHCALFLSLGI